MSLAFQDSLSVRVVRDPDNPELFSFEILPATAENMGGVRVAGDVYAAGEALLFGGIKGIEIEETPVRTNDFVLALDDSAMDPVRGVGAVLRWRSMLGGVDRRTGTTEEISKLQRGKLITFNNASAQAVTLKTSEVGSWFLCTVYPIGAGAVTLTPDSGTINGAANLPLTGGTQIFCDGTNWTAVLFGSGGGGGGSLSGDVTGLTSATVVEKLRGFTLSIATPNDGEQFQWNSGTAKYELVLDKPVFFPSAVPGKPAASQPVIIYTCAGAPITFPANFTSPSAKGSVGVNPTATATYTVQKNGVTAGTIVISTLGVFAFATTSGLPFTLNIGDRFTAIAPGTQDATLSDVGFTLLGTRGATVSPGTTNPVIVWMGQYDITGTTTYGTYNEVGYLGSSYIAKQPSTGVLPTNTTYWDLVSAAGANGVTAAVDVQQQTYVYCGTGGGTANAITLTPSPALASTPDGTALEFKASANNTTAVTINPSGLGAVALKKPDGSALTGGEIASGSIYRIVKNTSNWQLEGAAGGIVIQDVAGSVVVTGASTLKLPNGSLSNPFGGVAQMAGGLVLLEQHTASGSASLDFTTAFTSIFDVYTIELINLVPATNGAALLVRMSTNGGSSYDSASNYKFQNSEWFSGSSSNTFPFGSSGATSIQFGFGITNTSLYAMNGTIKYFNPLSASMYKGMNWHWFGMDSNHTSDIAFIVGSGVYAVTTAANALSFFFSAGNITSGIIRVYGVCK
jgi:hypothetical protein